MAATHRYPDPGRSILYALGANVTIAAAKLAGAAFTGSGALLAEGLHSLADTGNQVLLLLGRRQARARPSARHPLGHGRATYFWAFVVALLLFGVGGVVSIYEGVHKLERGAPIEAPWAAVAIVLFAMAAEAVSLRTALSQVAKVRHDRSLWSWFRETRHSELIVVVSEDLAAIAGLSIALAALLVTIGTANPLYDAAGSIAIGVLLMIVASGLAAEIKSLLIGESAAPSVRRAIRAFLKERPGILAIRDLVTTQHGDDIVVAVRAQLRGTTACEIVATIAEIKAALQAEFPQVAWIFFEPTEGSGRPATRSALRAQRRSNRSRRRAA